MAYFPNMTAWELWATENCFKCAHWSERGCPVEMAHTLYCYDLCNAENNPGKVILDLLIPPTNDGLGAEKCAMFAHKQGVTKRHLRDWEKYKAIMAEASA